MVTCHNFLTIKGWGTDFNSLYSKSELLMQGSFCICAQPMRDDVTIQSRLSLAGHIYKMIPAHVSDISTQQDFNMNSYTHTDLRSTDE